MDFLISLLECSFECPFISRAETHIDERFDNGRQPSEDVARKMSLQVDKVRIEYMPEVWYSYSDWCSLVWIARVWYGLISSVQFNNVWNRFVWFFYYGVLLRCFGMVLGSLVQWFSMVQSFSNAWTCDPGSCHFLVAYIIIRWSYQKILILNPYKY